ncbi:MAG: hypothetical protein O2964_07675 [Verrucomicrobia bacterium]|jgi:hypothetical protein|nr:hypothetical protein [Verrucomicrobiota bacterium]
MFGSRVEPASPLLLNERHFKFETISESALSINRLWFIKTHPSDPDQIFVGTGGAGLFHGTGLKND